MYAEMYTRTMEHFLGVTAEQYTFVVAYALDWVDAHTAVPEQGKSFINLAQICAIDVIGYDNERTE